MMRHIAHDHLRWLLASMALVLAPLFWHLPLWVPLFALLLGAWRYHIALRRLALPRLRILLPMALIGAAAIIASYGGSFGRDASVALLTLMMSMKLLESNSRREAMLLVFLSWFLVITVFLFSQSLLLGTYMVLPVVALTATLISISHPEGTLPAKFKLLLAGRLLGQALPVMLVLFLLFPRLSGPLWSVPQDAVSGMSGLSEDMSPGSISQLSLSDEIAFRAEFKDKLPDPAQRYWRGPVFWHFDGRTWRPGFQTQTLPQEKLEGKSTPVRYTVTLEPHNRTWLFTLDMAATIPPESKLSHDYQLTARNPVQTRTRYQASSYLQYQLQAQAEQTSLKHALQLPSERNNPRTHALGREWAASGAEPASIVQRALTMFREQPYVYTLAPPLLGSDGVDEFLFSTRRGFCEHYAGSFVLLMRAAGIPARVVTGYQGGEVNPLGNYMIVRQADAHAWAEVWFAGRGWVRVDPTAAVSPRRIESGMAAALPEAEMPLLGRGDQAWLHRIYLGWDAINNGWNQWVLGYNQQRQIEFLSRIAGTGISAREMVAGLAVSVTLIMCAISWAILRGGNQRRDEILAAYLKFVRKLARAGIVRDPHDGPLDFGLRAASALPDSAHDIADISSSYADLRYGGTPTLEQIETFKRKIKKFRA